MSKENFVADEWVQGWLMHGPQVDVKRQAGSRFIRFGHYDMSDTGHDL